MGFYWIIFALFLLKNSFLHKNKIIISVDISWSFIYVQAAL